MRDIIGTGIAMMLTMKRINKKIHKSMGFN